MKRVLALLLGGLGLRALFRRRTPAAVGPSPAHDLRAKLDETRLEAGPVAEAVAKPEVEPSVGDRRSDVHAKARAAIDELKED